MPAGKDLSLATYYPHDTCYRRCVSVSKFLKLKKAEVTETIASRCELVRNGGTED